MEPTIILIICTLVPILSWIPVAGWDTDRRDSRIGPVHMLVFGALAAIPAIALRLSEPAASSVLSYFTAHAFYRSLLIDGLAGTLMPLSVLLIALGVFGRTDNPKNIAVRSSLFVLGYVLLDGFFALGFKAAPMDILDAFIRSLPKLALAPLWGILLSYATRGFRRVISIGALVIIGTAFIGVSGFLLEMGRTWYGLITAGVSLAVMFLMRPESYIDRNYHRTTATADANSRPAAADAPSPERQPPHRVYGLMKQRHYDDARIAAERYLESHNDLYLFAWHALLRWIAGEKSCKLIFLQRYEALSDQVQQRLCDHLEEYLGYYAEEVDRWITRLEASYYPKPILDAV